MATRSGNAGLFIIKGDKRHSLNLFLRRNLFKFEAHEGGVSQSKLALTHRLGTATVERWYQSFVKQRVSELSGRNCPQVLGIDEHFLTRNKGYATTLVDEEP